MSGVKLALLFGLAVPLMAAPKMKDYKPRWKTGQSWRVEYLYQQPSAAGVLDPGSEARREIWNYQVTADKGGWKLTVRELRSPATPERFELTLTPELAVIEVRRFNHLSEGYQVFNDVAEGFPGFRADSINAPILDWPDWDAAAFEDSTVVLKMEKRGYNGFQETFRWKKSKPWWSQAERRFGDSGVKARLIEAD